MLILPKSVNYALPLKALTSKGLVIGPLQHHIGLPRFYSAERETKPPSSVKGAIETHNRLQKIISKSRTLSKLNQNPKFAHYFSRLSEAGVTSTVTSFLILHEITAIVPLFGLWWVFYQLDLPDQYELPLYFTNLLDQCGDAMEKLVGDDYSKGFDKNRLILSGAISYAIIKVLYPLRVLVSLWAAPYLGKLLLLPLRKIKSLFDKKTKGVTK